MRSFTKLVLAFAALLFSYQNSSAQACYGGSCYGGSGAPSNELGVRLGGLTNSSTDGGFYSADQLLHVGFFGGVHYKRYQSVGAVRTALGYTHYDVETVDDCPNCIKTEGEVNQVKVRLGYEWFTFFGPFEPYAGVDMVAAFGKYEGETYTYGQTGSDFWSYTEIRNKRGFGFAPVVGLRFYLGSYASLGVETTFETMLYNRKSLVSNLNTERSTINMQRNYYETTFHPLSWVSLNVLF